MKALVDCTGALRDGLAALRARYQVASGFAPEVLAAAEEAARRPFTEHADRTDRPFVTLDPAASTDLDQAFAIETSGADILLHYAIADVPWFVREGDVIDQEAWKRGATLYLPDGRVGLYPPILSENAASLLPSGPRPTVIFTVRVAPDGSVRLDGAERAVIRSRAKLAYDLVQPDELPPGFAELSRRVRAAEDERGAARVDPPEQEVDRIPAGGFELRFRPRAAAEDQNASLSLACNLAVAAVMLAHQTGLFRVMPEPDQRAIQRLRHTARAFGLQWPGMMPLAQFERRLDPARPKDAAFMLAVRRASPAASYVPFNPSEPPWHAAMAAAYAHATAPLRRLADRYVVMTVLALANGRRTPDAALQAFPRLTEVMAEAEAYSNRMSRAAIDLAEAIMLRGREGQIFPAVVTDIDQRGARMQLRDLPIVSRIDSRRCAVGDDLNVRLISADPPAPRFEAAR